MNLNHGKPTFLGRFQIMGGAADFKVGVQWWYKILSGCVLLFTCCWHC